ncbi:SEC-C metal-binding domain-containing protein [Alkalibacterium sp. 20]|uniref:SEC-C metal-binding domain-containing protein n=1 Tax=Alkalibacterium sp. 20 TaxID=1798803 RepID=UPI000914CE49|nr:SEC-C metal-binding domain-containing protein [Alkalibacterium sp. 20]OJF92811.1 hypothetical protein AX762_09500 [Alkalibacterium sp. 20]
MNLLSQYIVALSHLYGAVHKEVVVDIYKSQNDDEVRIKEVEEYLNNPSEEIEKHFAFSVGDYFAYEAIMEFDELDELLQKQSGRPRYIPEKSELLNYIDSFYFEKTAAYYKLYDYLLKYVLDGDEERTSDICEDVQGMIEVNASFRQVMSVFDHMHVDFIGKNQRETVKQLVKVLKNNVRLWINNGYTNKELKEMDFRDSSKKINRNQNSMTKKLGRNDPCYCGSGKKYKKCCLEKNEK